MKRASKGSAGHDLSSLEDYTLQPMERKLFKTGVRRVVPSGRVGLLCARSGLALKHGLTVLNAPGIIDEDYDGDVSVMLINLSRKPYDVKKGDRIGQLVIVAYDVISDSDVDRQGGFGSSGK